MNISPQPRRRSYADHVHILLAAGLAALVLRTFCLDAALVPSHSMESTLLPGDYVLVNKLIYGSSSPRSFPFTRSDIPFFRLPALSPVERGDVVVFERPGGTVRFIKRCIARGGDTVSLRRGVITVNGEEVRIPGHPAGGEDVGPVVIPRRGTVVDLRTEPGEAWDELIRLEGHALARDPSGRRTIDGLPAGRYVVEKDYVFVLGDNLSRSEDSRSWGFLPEDKILGKALMVYWSAGDSGLRVDRIGRMIR